MTDDLQEQLQKPSKQRRVRIAPDATLAAVAARTIFGYSLVGSSKKKPAKSPVDIHQWVIRPNGVFAAASSTTPSLPPGVYDIGSDNDGNLQFQFKNIVTDDLIDLHDSNSLKVINGIKKFWTMGDRYRERGLIYKRGILMWGPPGSGKTATLTLLTKSLIEQGGTVFIVKAPGLIKIGLQQFRSIEPDRPIIVIFEDIDEIIAKHGEHEILALLDGENQTENIVSIATTNYPEELGARIVNRPSRFDEVIKIDMPSLAMRREYLKHIIRETDKFPVEQALKDTDKLSISHLKELVIAVTCLDQDYDETIKRLQTMKHKPKSTQTAVEVGFN
jgi:AAA+ superfamily predicted ATPase